MKKKILTLVLASTLSATLVGCGGNKTPTEVSYRIPEVNVVSVADLKAAGTTKITFWHSFTTEPTVKALTHAIESFEKDYPYIDVEEVSKGGYDNLKSAVTLEIPTSNTPDVVIGYPDHFSEYIAGEVLVPIEKYIQSKDKEIGIADMDDFYPSYMEEVTSLIEGHTFGLPFNKSTEVLSYNKTFFDAHHLEVPKTWDEVRTVSQQVYDIVGDVMKTEDKIDTVSGLDFSKCDFDKFYPMSWDAAANQFITIVQQWGGTYTELESFDRGVIKFDSAEGKAAVQWFKDMYTDHLFAPPAVWEQQYANKAGFFQFIMSIGSSAGAQYYAAAPYEVGVAAVPYKDEKHKQVIQQGTNVAMLSNNSDEERLASWLFMKYLTSAEINAEFALAAGYYPVRKSGTASQIYQDFLHSEPETPAAASTIGAAKVNAEIYLTSHESYFSPAFIGSSEVRNVVGTIMPAVTVTGQSVDDVFADVISQLPNYK